MNAELPIVGDVLVVDDDSLVGTMLANQIRQTGRSCYLVDSYRAALEHLERSPSIQLVILDHGIQPDDLPSFVEKVHQQHLTTTLIGSSGRDCRTEFAQAGVGRFLLKPWSLTELRDELEGPEAETEEKAASFSDSPARLTVGDRCRPICDRLARLEGIVESKHDSGRLTIRLNAERMLGVLLEIDADAVQSSA